MVTREPIQTEGKAQPRGRGEGVRDGGSALRGWNSHGPPAPPSPSATSICQLRARLSPDQGAGQGLDLRGAQSRCVGHTPWPAAWLVLMSPCEGLGSERTCGLGRCRGRESLGSGAWRLRTRAHPLTGAGTPPSSSEQRPQRLFPQLRHGVRLRHPDSGSTNAVPCRAPRTTLRDML